MIVLTDAQKLFLDEFLLPFANYMKDNNVEVKPVLIKDGSYILPRDLLTAKVFEPIKDALFVGGHLANITIREVSKDELIEPKFP